MDKLKILVVEDGETDLGEIKDAAELFEDKQKNITVELIECRSVADALTSLDDSFHGAIVDIKLEGDGDGNDVLEAIQKEFRIPVKIVTGTPYKTATKFKALKPIRKGRAVYLQVIEEFRAIEKTGLLRILGGQGLIEERINEVFWHLYPDIGLWSAHQERGKDAERALLRITVNHLDNLLSNGDERHLPEEMYNYQIGDEKLRTGSLLSCRSNLKNYIMLSPACDLARRKGGTIKTDSILLCEIEQLNHVKARVLKDITKGEKINRALTELFKNNDALYTHWLPPFGDSFKGGFINFRKILSISETDLMNDYKYRSVHVAGPYVKDIVSRFSSYYGRQGQPDLDSTHLVEEHANIAKKSVAAKKKQTTTARKVAAGKGK